MATQTMQAVWYERQGKAQDVMQYGEMPIPEPGIGEVRVRLHASGVNPSDTKVRGGWGGITMSFPRVIPHQDGAGTIDRVGEGVPESLIGERVWVYEAQQRRPFGTAAEYTIVPTQQAEATLRTNGAIAMYAVPHPDIQPVVPILSLMQRNITIRTILVYTMLTEAKQAAIRDLTATLDAGALTHNIARSFPLTDVAAAHEVQDSGKTIGKVIIEIA